RPLLARIDPNRLRVVEEQKRRQRLVRLHAPWRRLLRNRQRVNRRKVEIFALARIDVRQRGIRGPQVDSDLHAFTRSRTLNSSFHLRPSRATHHSSNTPVSVTTVSNETGTSCPVPSVAGRSTSIGESSSRSCPTSSIKAPIESFLRVAEP